jgi:hypothetical protein
MHEYSSNYMDGLNRLLHLILFVKLIIMGFVLL